MRTRRGGGEKRKKKKVIFSSGGMFFSFPLLSSYFHTAHSPSLFLFSFFVLLFDTPGAVCLCVSTDYKLFFIDPSLLEEG